MATEENDEAVERKEKSERRLELVGVAVNESLPLVEEKHEVTVRGAAETARRCLCLLVVCAAADGVDRAAVRRWLEEEKLWEHCSPKEAGFLSAPQFDEAQALQFGWRSEALWVLLWAIGLVAELADPIEQRGADDILPLVPELGESTQPFMANARMRSAAAILSEADYIYRAHWATRNWTMQPSTNVGPLSPSVVMERHHALNWLISYGDADWDDVACDT